MEENKALIAEETQKSRKKKTKNNTDSEKQAKIVRRELETGKVVKLYTESKEVLNGVFRGNKVYVVGKLYRYQDGEEFKLGHGITGYVTEIYSDAPHCYCIGIRPYGKNCWYCNREDIKIGK